MVLFRLGNNNDCSIFLFVGVKPKRDKRKKIFVTRVRFVWGSFSFLLSPGAEVLPEQMVCSMIFSEIEERGFAAKFVFETFAVMM